MVISFIFERLVNNVMGRKRTGRPRGRPVVYKVYCYELDMMFESCTEAANFVGGFRQHIWDACVGLMVTYKGFHWAFWYD